MYKVNTSMESTTNNNEPQKTQNIPIKGRPDDQGNFAILGHVKIFDPNSDKVYVEIRE